MRLCSWMKFFVIFLEFCRTHASINLSRGNVGMPEKFLNTTKVGSPLEHMRSKGVTKDVRMHLLFKLQLFSVSFQNLPKSLSSKGQAALIDEYFIVIPTL